KSNSAILNSLLTLINERLFYNNGTPIKSPLVSLIGASNEYPEDDEGLEAMFDRLLLKYEVKPVRERENRIKIRKGVGKNVQIPTLSLEELGELQMFTAMVNMSDQMHEVFDDIYMDLVDEGINISQRRTDQSINALKAKAFLDNRSNVEEKDMIILQHILWNDISEKEIATNIIKKYAQDIVANTIDRVKAEANDIVESYGKVDPNNPYDDARESAQKLKLLSNELEDLKLKNPGRAKDINVVLKKLADEQQKLVDKVLMPIN
ncbi:ATPase, partial [Butyricicoccus sp. 1XD8-22]